MNTVFKLKKATTIMELIGMCLSVISAIFAIVLLFSAGKALSQSEEYLSSGNFDELVAGFQVVGGALVLVGSALVQAFIVVLLIIIFALLITFFIPFISGIRLKRKTDQYLEMGLDFYRKKAKKDSALKLIFGGIPCLCFLYTMFDQELAGLILIALYYAAICLLEIIALRRLSKCDS